MALRNAPGQGDDLQSDGQTAAKRAAKPED